MNKLPNGWQEKKLKDICIINYGKGLGKSNMVDGNIPVYGSSGIIGFHNNYLVNSAGIIIGRKGNAGKIFYSDKPFFCIDTAFYIEPDNQYDLKYLFYKLVSMNLKNNKTGTAVPGLIRNDVYKLAISIPPIDEQKRIASILSSLDDKIELNNKTNRILEELAQTIFEEWFINFNFPNEDGKPYKKSGGEMIGSKLGKIPKGWKVGTIGDYAKLKSGFAFKNSWWQNDGIPVIKIQNISSGNLNLEQCSFVSEDKYNIAENFRVNGGDLLISLTGSLGKFAIVPKLDKDALVNQRVGKFFLGKEPVKKLPFLYGILNELKDLIVSLANGSVQQNISPTDIENVKIIFPSDKMLNKYNNLMQDVFYKIIFNQRENEKLSGIRDSLLPKLMDGEIRV